MESPENEAIDTVYIRIASKLGHGLSPEYVADLKFKVRSVVKLHEITENRAIQIIEGMVATGSSSNSINVWLDELLAAGASPASSTRVSSEQSVMGEYYINPMAEVFAGDPDMQGVPKETQQLHEMLTVHPKDRIEMIYGKFNPGHTETGRIYPPGYIGAEAALKILADYFDDSYPPFMQEVIAALNRAVKVESALGVAMTDMAAWQSTEGHTPSKREIFDQLVRAAEHRKITRR